jgi:hypothetical protein
MHPQASAEGRQPENTKIKSPCGKRVSITALQVGFDKNVWCKDYEKYHIVHVSVCTIQLPIEMPISWLLVKCNYIW